MASNRTKRDGEVVRDGEASPALDIPGAGVAVLVEKPRCKVCGVPLLTHHESKIGVHVRCVFEVNIKSEATHIPVPGYRTRRVFGGGIS